MALDAGTHTINMDEISGAPLRHYSVSVGMISAAPNFNNYQYSIAAPTARIASDIAMRVCEKQFKGCGWSGFHIASILDTGTAEVK